MNLFIGQGLLRIFALIFLTIFASCVGQIEDPNQQIANLTQIDFTFDGVVSGKATAHNKVRLSFNPASGGSGKFNYIVYLNGNKLVPAASLPFSNATADSDNLLHVTVDGLVTGTENTFVVNAQDISNGKIDLNNKELLVSSLNYEVPNFNGITSLDNLSGSAGKTQLIVRWNKATPSSVDPNNFFGNDVNAISGYTIYVGTSSSNLAVNAYVNDPNATAFLLTNLDVDRNYFVRVRARNSAAIPTEDLNEEFKSRKTLTSQPISFAGAKLATIPSNISGFSSANVSWLSGSGDFDRYRIYLSSTSSSFDPSTESPKMEITNLGLTSATVSGLNPNTDYSLVVVACKKSANNDFCDQYKGQDVVKTITTSPPVAPFNGIKSVAQTEGAAGLTQLRLTWDAPNTSFGVYDRIDVFRVVSGVQETLPLGEYTGSNLGKLIPLSNSTGTVIDGAVVGTNYCFIAKAFSGTRSDSNQVVTCFTPTLTNPGFNGLTQNGCTRNGNSVTLSWDVPNPVGIFDKFQIFYRIKPSVGTFDFDAAVTGDATYTTVDNVSSSALSKSILNLTPGSVYQFGMKTYFQHPISQTITRIGLDQSICEVTIPASNIIHQGWDEIFAIGPKRNGLTNDIVIERIRQPGDSDYVHPVPMEDSSANPGVAWNKTSPTLNGSKTGIVRLVWPDFKFASLANKSIYDYRNSATGYNIYRLKYDSTNPAHTATYSPSLSDSTWVKLNPSLIEPQLSNNFKFGEWIDYTAGNAERSLGANLDRAETYWYKVEPVLNGAVVAYETQPSDGVIKVILPPLNKALVHRWIANKQVCGDLQRPIDRSKHYRCEYNGLASKKYLVDGIEKDFYDYGGHLIADRFELGINFSRSSCSLVGNRTNSYFIFEGAASNGDCVGYGPLYNSNTGSTWQMGFGNPNGSSLTNALDKITAPENSVYYNRSSSMESFHVGQPNVYIFRSGAWRNLNNYDTASLTGGIVESSTVPPSQSIIPAKVSGVTDSGVGLGSIISTNNANMPPFSKLPHNKAYKLCMSHKFEFRGRNYYNRLLRRKENIVAQSLPNPNLFKSETSQSITNDLVSKGCYTNQFKSERLRTLTNPPLNFDTYDDKYPLTSINGTFRWVLYATGSESTSNCVSRFGLQDFVGNLAEWSSDVLWCDRSPAPSYDTNGMCSPRYKNLTPNSNPTDLFDPPWDKGNIANYKSGNGTYYLQGEGEYMGMNPKKVQSGSYAYLMAMDPVLMGTPPNTSWSHDSNYFNVAMGLPLKCAGTSCGDAGNVNNPEDDNLLVTARSSTQVTTDATKVFKFDYNSDVFFHLLNIKSSVLDTNIWGLVGSSSFRSYWTNNAPSQLGRWSHIWAGYNAGFSEFYHGARCGIMIEENEDGVFINGNGDENYIAPNTNNMGTLL
jgi:hypothetical protein